MVKMKEKLVNILIGVNTDVRCECIFCIIYERIYVHLLLIVRSGILNLYSIIIIYYSTILVVERHSVNIPKNFNRTHCNGPVQCNKVENSNAQLHNFQIYGHCAVRLQV